MKSLFINRNNNPLLVLTHNIQGFLHLNIEHTDMHVLKFKDLKGFYRVIFYLLANQNRGHSRVMLELDIHIVD